MKIHGDEGAEAYAALGWVHKPVPVPAGWNQQDAVTIISMKVMIRLWKNKKNQQLLVPNLSTDMQVLVKGIHGNRKEYLENALSLTKG